MKKKMPENQNATSVKEPEHAVWRRRLFIMNCIIATSVFVLEICVNLILMLQHKIDGGLWYQLTRYLLIPSGLVYLAVLVDFILLKKLPDRDKLLNYVMVLSVVFMCTVVAVTHYVFPITMTAFIIPVLMSVVFGDKRLTDVTSISCCGCILLTGIWRNIDGGESDRNYVVQEVFISVGILLLSLIVARIVISIMTEQNRQLLEAIEKEKQSQQQADAANKAKSAFLANMSHEIRTPINAILGMNEMILREEKDPSIREYAGNIQASGSSLLSIVNDVLDISKIETGKLEIIPSVYEVNSLVSDCCNMVVGRAKAKGLELIVECAGDVPMSLLGDETHVRQIIVNLLTNAVKYTEKGSVRLIVGGSENPEGYRLCISVKDTGIGISADDQPRLFSQFQRFDLQKNRNIEGTGLGLSIVKKLCDLMNGSVSVESEPGSGSVFSVEIPQKIADRTPCGGINLNYSRSTDYEYAHSFEAPEARLLAVDDLPVNLLVIVNMLKETGMQIDTAYSGRECLEKAAAKRYDLILMDHMMPELDGVQTFRRLRSDETSASRGTPVIMLTANALAGVREQYIGEGFADYISKPVRGARLEETIRRNLPPELVHPAHKQEQPPVSAAGAGLEDLADKLPELNLNIAMPYCCDSRELFLELLNDFTSGTRFDEMQTAFADQNWEEYRRLAHSLKSTALTIGLERLSERARSSEYSLKNGCVEFAQLNHDALMTEYAETLGKIKEYLKDKSE